LAGIINRDSKAKLELEAAKWASQLLEYIAEVFGLGRQSSIPPIDIKTLRAEIGKLTSGK